MSGFDWANDNTRKFMERGYLLEGQTVEDRVGQIASSFEHRLVKMGMKPKVAMEFSNKFYENMAKGFYSLATPIWTNYGTDRGYPVSCFGSVAGDSMESIAYTVAETIMLMKNGGGTSGSFSQLRGRGSPIRNNGTSSGAVHFMQLFEEMTSVISQGSARRGFFTPYLHVNHPDIDEFLTIGDEGHPIQDMTTGVVLDGEFLKKAEAGDKTARKRLAKIHKQRSELGYPYIVFEDNAQEGRPDVYKDLGMEIKASNMCSEIMLPSNERETFVCVLSSMNLAKYDEWKKTDAVGVLTVFLDTVVEEFIEKLKEDKRTKPHFFLDRVLRFAKRHRALGLGVLGWHHLLQSKMLPFESREAAQLNLEVFKHLRDETLLASKYLASEFGAPKYMYDAIEERRNTTLMAIAPTKSSSFILGQTSQSIEPEFANTYIKDLAKIKVTIRNPYLEKVLESYGKNDPETWAIIEEDAGSVQGLDFLSDLEKDVFKTFPEINPKAIIDQAGVRQSFIDQGQSVNLIISPSMSLKEINELLYRAWAVGLKSLYYQYGMNAAQELTRKRLKQTECVACEG